MVLGRYNTVERNDTLRAVKAGTYGGRIRAWMGGLGECVADEGNWVSPAGPNLTDCTSANAGQIANARQWCTAEQLANNSPGAWNDQNSLFDVMAVCFYTAQWLLDAVIEGGGEPFPIGLIQNAVGGSMIEQVSGG